MQHTHTHEIPRVTEALQGQCEGPRCRPVDAAHIMTTDFDCEQVFSDLDEPLALIRKASPSARKEAAELFRALAAWCFSGHCQLHPAVVKFVAIISGLRPDLLGDRPGIDLAAELGVSKQALTRQSLRFQDAFNIKFSRSRSKDQRERMAAARRGGPNRNTKSL
jgi:hypothetical protein